MLVGIMPIDSVFREEAVIVVSDSVVSSLCNPPGSSVHGVLQARILEWVAISFSWGSS